MSTYGQRLRDQIDTAFAAEVAKTEDGFRFHLGASQIGDPCWRKIWFGYRWADKEEFSGRMLRLFETGQLYEERFARLLRLIGAAVWTHDEAGKQYKVKAHGGHFGGSNDAVAANLPELGDEPVLVEMKSHNEKSFAKLLSEGVHISKLQHVRQAQVYATLWGIKKILYVAVNKNTDELHFELFDHDPAVGAQMLEKAEHIIFGKMPHRISESAAYYECRWCPMNGVCFHYKKPLVNCRTCVNSKPERDGTWSCALGRYEILSQPKSGCEKHEYMTELL